MKKITFILFIFVCLSMNSQLPGKLDSLILAFEKLKDDTLKVDRFLFVAEEASGIDSALSGKYGRRAFELAKKINDSKGIGNAYNYFGKAHYLKQNYDTAIVYFEKAAAIFEKINFVRGITSALNNCGAIYNEKGDYDKALVFHEKALKINLKTKNEAGVGNNYLNMGNTANLKGDYESAMNFFLKAETIFSKLKKWESLATTYYNFAYVMYNLRQLNKAEEYCLKSLKIREEKTLNKVGMSYSHVFLAAVFSDSTNLNIPKAKYHFNKVLELCKETGDRITLLSSRLNYGRIFLNINQPDSALIQAQKALEMSREIGSQKFICGSLCFIGEIQYKLKKTTEAIKYYTEGYELAEKIGDDAYFINCAQGLSRCYFALSKYKESYSFLLTYTQRKDLLLNKENVKAISGLEAKYQNQKKQLEIEGLTKDKKLQQLELDAEQKESATKNKILIIGSFALIGICVFAFFAFSNFKKSQKANVIINSQKQQVELQKEEIEHQKILVEEKQKEIIDSINYAQKIQAAVLTGEDVWKKISPENFILFQPKDIVSGDFYWAFNTMNNRSVIVLADCTGHGVPGGFMSMLGNSLLNEIVVENKIFKPDQILNKLRQKIISSLGQKGSADRRDGMDMAICTWNKLDNSLEFAGANNRLWIIRNGSLTEYSGDKMPVGNFEGNAKLFSCQTVQLEKNDLIVLCTDGFADQFGGDGGKKFMSKNLKNFIVNNSDLPLEKQKTELHTLFNSWKGNNEQVDDVSLIMIKVV